MSPSMNHTPDRRCDSRSPAVALVIVGAKHMKRILKPIAVVCGLIIPAPVVLAYALISVVTGVGMIWPGSAPFEERVDAALWFFVGAAQLVGFVSIWSALAVMETHPLRRWEILGLWCSVVVSSASLSLLASGLVSTELPWLLFGLLAFCGPGVVSFCCLVTSQRQNEKPNQLSPSPSKRRG
jgi:hypothetical protein